MPLKIVEKDIVRMDKLICLVQSSAALMDTMGSSTVFQTIYVELNSSESEVIKKIQIVIYTDQRAYQIQQYNQASF